MVPEKSKFDLEKLVSTINWMKKYEWETAFFYYMEI